MNKKNVSIDLLLEYLYIAHELEPVQVRELSRVRIKNQVFFIQTKKTDFVLKIYLDESKERRANNEWEALNHLSKSFPFVKAPIFYDPRPSILPGPILMNPYIEGIELKETIGSIAYSEQNWIMLMKHVIELMCKVHSLSYEIDTDYNKYLKRKFNMHFRTADDFALERLGYDPCVDLYLCKRECIVPERLATCHGDLGAHQIIMHKDFVTSIIDWEDYCLNDPALDIGYLTFSTVRDYFPDIAKVHRLISLIKAITRLKNLEFFISERAIGTMLVEFMETTPKNRKIILDFINTLLSE